MFRTVAALVAPLRKSEGMRRLLRAVAARPARQLHLCGGPKKKDAPKVA